jgi:hypothetical protein
MAGAVFVPSLFHRICLRTLRRVGCERFTPLHVNPSVKKVLKIAALDSMVG